MKKIFLILGLSAFILSSCEDATEIRPIDSIDAEAAFETVDDLELGISGVYSIYTPQNIIQFSSRFADDLQVGEDSGGQGRNLHAQQLNATDATATAIWSNNYDLINRANRLLLAAESVNAETADEISRKNRIIGECYALRALAHFELLAHFSTSYTDDNALGVPYIDYVVVFEEPGRDTVGTVLAGIASDIAEAESFIDSGLNDNTRVTLDMLTALKSKIAIYTGDNAAAMTFSNDLISNYPLANQAQYRGIFTDTDNTEVIFKAKRVQTDGVVVGGFPGGLFYFTGTGGAFFEMSRGLFEELLDLPASDVRTEVLLDIANSDVSRDFFLINKYPGSGGINFLNDLKIFRVSEQYLIRAEAQAKMGDLPGAALSIKAIRDARTGLNTAPDTYTGLEDAINAILAERRVELAYEGHRYLDLKRTRNITSQGIVRNPADCGGDISCGISANDFRFTLPIPQGELNGNSVIREQQNPGYTTN